ncbi:MAG: hypothetical protein K8W52_42145 [Deltaproteobacteria bacterium]|nr:hypothetical protein [Deltaproteobacteria bacterium]
MRRLAAAFLAMSMFATAAGAAPIATHDRPAPPDMKMLAPLPAPSRALVIKALAARRAKNLAAFRAYRKAGVYPHNFVRSGPLNVWRDEEGHLCAAATMLHADGQDAIVEQVATSNNNLRLLDVTSGPAMDWLLTSGFTLEEIDRIQMPGWRPSMREQEPAGWRIAEDKRLRRGYIATEAWLAKHRTAGLAMAADRLLENRGLARALVDQYLTAS